MEQFAILVCDDDREIVAALEIYLANEGYKVLKAFNGREALTILKNEHVDLIVLDIMMPEMDGIHATVKIREEKNIPIIMLSAKSEDSDKILGLNLGADDYITKPFNPLELIARVKAQLRRYATLGSREIKEHVYHSGGLVLDDQEKRVTVDEKPVNLTPIEYNILKLLLMNKGRVFSTDQIYEHVWQEPPVSSSNLVSVHIRHLREKIEVDPQNPMYLKVVWGLGYKIERVEK
ncbi:MAG: response regulator transcription factor [Firmicutes bacterium]|nr:response regulator transcription factor [Bacillota bacterium]